MPGGGPIKRLTSNATGNNKKPKTQKPPNGCPLVYAIKAGIKPNAMAVNKSSKVHSPSEMPRTI
jgi:hypothetical protein